MAFRLAGSNPVFVELFALFAQIERLPSLWNRTGCASLFGSKKTLSSGLDRAFEKISRVSPKFKVHGVVPDKRKPVRMLHGIQKSASKMHIDWQQFLASQSLSSSQSKTVKMKRRIKPTLISHIGIPNLRSSFSTNLFDDTRSDVSSKLDLRRLSLRDTKGSSSASDVTAQIPNFQLGTLNVPVEAEHKILQLVFFTVREAGKDADNYIKAVSTLAHLFKILHHVYRNEDEKCTIEFLNEIEADSDPVNLTYLERRQFLVLTGLEIFKGLFKRICSLTPSFIPFFENNVCLKRHCPKIFAKLEKVRNSQARDSFISRASIHQNDLNTGVQDPYDAIAYVDRRDSRNFVEHPHLHANQQKVRDAFLDLVRSNGSDLVNLIPNSESFADFQSKTAKSVDFQRKAQDVLLKLLHENYGWFADLLLYHYEVLRKRTLSPNAITKDRLERLEERLTKSSSIGGREKTMPYIKSLSTNFVAQFIASTDSHRLHVQLERRVWQLIDETESQVISRHGKNSSEHFLRLSHLAKLAAFLDSQTSTYRSDFNVRLRQSFAQGFLVVRLPWVLSYLKEISIVEPVSIEAAKFVKAYMNLKEIEFNKCRFYCSVLINSFLSSVNNLPEASFGSEFDLQANNYTAPGSLPDYETTLDLDHFLEMESTVYHHLLTAVRQVSSDDLQSSPVKPLPTEPNLPQDFRPTRKIRPITLPRSETKPKSAKPLVEEEDSVQMRLRHWYWWQWPDFKTVTDPLVQYAVHLSCTSMNHVCQKGDKKEAQSSPSQEQTEAPNSTGLLDNIRKVLETTIPPLLPPILNGNQRAVELSIALCMEMAEKYIL